MNKVKNFLKKLPLKFIVTNLFFVILLITLYLSSFIPLFTMGFFFDVFFFIGLVSVIYFSVGNNLAKNIIFTIIGLIFTFLFNVDHIYYGFFSKFASASSLVNADMVLDNLGAYEINIDIINIIYLIVYGLFVTFLFVFKEKNKKFKERVFYSIPMVLVLVPFVTIYILCYNDQLFLDLLLFPKRHKFPNFINSFGYIFYRYEDLMVVLESLGG